MHTYTHEDLKRMSDDVKLAQFLHDIYRWEDDYSISYDARKILWENKLAGKDQDSKWLDKHREQTVRNVQVALRVWAQGYSEVELEAEVAEDVVGQVLRLECSNIDIRKPEKVHAFCGAVFHTYPKVVGVMSTKNLTDKEAEAVVATDMATELLQEFFEHIQKDLRYYSEKYADYKVYSECAGVLAEDKDELLGRLTAWNHHITQGAGSAFLIISVWEPGKDPKSACRYYLVKE